MINIVTIIVVVDILVNDSILRRYSCLGGAYVEQAPNKCNKLNAKLVVMHSFPRISRQEFCAISLQQAIHTYPKERLSYTFVSDAVSIRLFCP